MLAGEGLLPSAKGKRVRLFRDGRRIVTDGPFAETRELIAGFWLWKVNSLDEAVEWVNRIPFDPETSPDDSEIEIRQVGEMEDFGDELTPEARAQEDRLRAEIEKQKD